MAKYKANNQIVFTETLKVFLASGMPIAIPAGATGKVEQVEQSDKGVSYTVRCPSPYTVYAGFNPFFLIEDDELEAISEFTGSANIPLAKPTDVYDADVPGQFREDSGYLANVGGEWGSELVYKRAFTDWKIVVQTFKDAISLDSIHCVYRTALGEERFSILDKESDFCFVQLHIQEDGQIKIDGEIAFDVTINPQNKNINVRLLFTEFKSMDVGRTYRASYLWGGSPK